MKDRIIKAIRRASAFYVDYDSPLLTSIEDLYNDCVFFTWHDADGNLFRQEVNLDSATIENNVITGHDDDGKKVQILLYKLTPLEV
jgi:hypothetical protein